MEHGTRKEVIAVEFSPTGSLNKIITGAFLSCIVIVQYTSHTHGYG